MKDAVAVVVKHKNRFLLIRRAKKDDYEDYWCPVTGAIEKDETQEQAVIREAKEELGITVKPIKKVWECYTENKQYLLHWWYGESTFNRIIENPSEVKEYRWLSCRQMQHIEKMFHTDLIFFREIAPNID